MPYPIVHILHAAVLTSLSLFAFIPCSFFCCFFFFFSFFFCSCWLAGCMAARRLATFTRTLCIRCLFAFIRSVRFVRSYRIALFSTRQWYKWYVWQASPLPIRVRTLRELTGVAWQLGVDAFDLRPTKVVERRRYVRPVEKEAIHGTQHTFRSVWLFVHLVHTNIDVDVCCLYMCNAFYGDGITIFRFVVALRAKKVYASDVMD